MEKAPEGVVDLILDELGGVSYVIVAPSENFE